MMPSQGNEEREPEDSRRRDVLGAARERVELGRDEVDDRLDGGVEQLGGNDHAAAEQDDGPAHQVKPQDDAHDHGKGAAAEHDLDVALRPHGGAEALQGKEEAPPERRVVLLLAGNHLSSLPLCRVNSTWSSRASVVDQGDELVLARLHDLGLVVLDVVVAQKVEQAMHQ